MKKIKEIMRDVARVAASAHLFAALAVMSATAAFADTNLTENVMLTEDTDWRSLGTVTIPDGVGVHLNGHKLYVAGFTGAGSIYASDIPAGYVELDYIETSGSQYIDTGISPYAAVKVDADIAALNGFGNYVPLICSSVWNMDDSVQARCYGVWAREKTWGVYFSGNYQASTAAVSEGARIHLVAAWSGTAQTLSVDGVSKLDNTTEYTGTSTDRTMSLPGWKSGSSMRNLSGAKFRIYSFKIYKPQDTLVRDYVPVRRTSDNAIGLFDRKNCTFSPSATETPFIAGNENEVGLMGGELHIDVANGTFNNSTVAISNGVKVVKEGAGTYMSQKGQTYTGGTVVSAGRVKIAGITSMSEFHGFGAVGSDVVVASNAQVVIGGCYQTLSGYNVTIAGDGPDNNGAIYGDNQDYVSWDSAFLKSLTLAGDASIKVAVQDSFNLRSGDDSTGISLCGHRLTAKGSARLIARKVNVTDVGSIIVSANNNFYVAGEMLAPFVNFEVAQGGVLVGDGAQTIVVSNMTFAGTWAPTEAKKSITVLGCYSPKSAAANWPTITLGDSEHLSPALDLSAISSTYDGTNLSFADGATISVNLGDRSISSNSRLVSWTAEPANRFVRGDSGVVGGLEKKSDGLYFVRRGFVLVVR